VTEEGPDNFFIEFLAKAVKTARVRIALTMRAEFYSRVLDYGQLAELMRATGTFPVGCTGCRCVTGNDRGPARIAGLQNGKRTGGPVLTIPAPRPAYCR